jgi:hypothetical protein
MDLNISTMWQSRGAYRVLLGNPEGKSHLGDPGVDGRIILKWILILARMW